MKLNVCKKSLLLIGGLLLSMSASAQYLRSSYYMEGAISRLKLNPGLQPTRGYINIPLFGSLGFESSCNSLGMGDIMDIIDTENNLFSNDKMFNRLKSKNNVNVSMSTDILSAGWYRGKGFWSLNLGLRADADLNIQKSMLDYLRQVNTVSRAGGISTMQDLTKLNGSFENMELNAKAWFEMGVGYSHPIGDKLTLGGRVKLLLGIARAETKVNSFSFNASYNNEYINCTPEQIEQMVGNGTLNENTPLGTVKTHVNAEVTTTSKKTALKYNNDGTIDKIKVNSDDIGTSGTGFGIDFGASYKVLDNLTISASVLDLGFISWKGSSTTKAITNTDETENITAGNYQEIYSKYSNTDLVDMDRFNLTEDKSLAGKSYSKKLASTVLLSGEYDLYDNKLALGGMYSVRFLQPVALHELTISATYRPKDWLNVALSYSPIQSAGKAVGLAFRIGPVVFGTDYLSFGGRSKSADAFLGISIPVGKSKPSND